MADLTLPDERGINAERGNPELRRYLEAVTGVSNVLKEGLPFPREVRTGCLSRYSKP